MRDLLRVPGMKVLLVGETTSTFGDWVLLLVLGIWVKSLTGSNSLAGAVLLAVAAPSILGPLTGWVVDRFRRRPFLIAVNVLSALAFTPLLLVSSRHDVWIIYVVAVLNGISFSVTGGAFAGLIKALVPDARLGSANGLFSSIRQLMRLVGPLIGAGLFAAFGGHAVALVDIASFVVAAVALAAVTVDEERPVRSELHWLHEVSAGIRHVWRAPVLRRTTLAVATAMLALGAVDTTIFAYLDQGLHRPPSFLGVLVTVQGLGAAAGALSAARVMARLGEVAVVAIGVTAFGVAIGLVIYPSLALALVAMPFAGVGNAVAFVAFSTLLQRRTPGPLMGRVSAATDTVVGGAQTASMAIGAGLVAVVDYRAVFAVISAVLLAVGALLWHARTAGEPASAPSVAAAEPEPADFTGHNLLERTQPG